MSIVANLVEQTTTSTGTGNLTLAAVDARQTCASAIGTGSSNTFSYFIMHESADEWERGTGYMSDSTTLVRSTVHESSNADAAVNFSAGTKRVTNAMPADELTSKIRPVADRTALKALNTSVYTTAYLKEAGRSGLFVFRSGDYSTEIAADTSNGLYVKADDTAATSGAWVRQYDGPIDVAWFGTTGDGVTDDTSVIQSAWDAASGTCVFLPTATGYAFSGRFDGSSGDIGLTTLNPGFLGRFHYYYEPQYDLSSNTLSVQHYFEMGDITLPSGASYQHNVMRFTGTARNNDAFETGGARFLAFQMDSYNADAYGIIGAVTLVDGAKEVKGIYGRGIAGALSDSGGIAIGLVGGATIESGSQASGAWALQLTVDGAGSLPSASNARYISFGTDQASKNAGYGIYSDPVVGFDTSFIRAFNAGSGPCISWQEPNGGGAGVHYDLFKVAKTGQVLTQIGSASAPSYSFTSSGTDDSNTGMFAPAADTIAWSTGGTERARLTSTGLGIGGTPSYKLDVDGTSGVRIFRAADPAQNIIITTDATSNKVVSAGSKPYEFETSGAYQIAFRTNATERMRVDASGNLCIGGTAAGTSSAGNINLYNGTAPTASITNGVILYAEDVTASSELKVRDEAGNITTLSPHNFSMIPEGPSEDMAWSYYSERDGKRINVDMLKALRVLERLSGEKLVFESD